ncbi:VOC family protein [Falsiroseomonas selenitidurans]|uniref:Lactoylglutathione lyase n=1 Tax=Falsiroseomonas selenitidurans TaxID=2716335 RepID=A0ABX1E6T4_9PROT|nr:lactoylglutathione lyase [Falsiroseomonas selenitidurans]NKC32900.1 lactoylglutathione lyase [Falsiroseomonas selenitidurans]
MLRSTRRLGFGCASGPPTRPRLIFVNLPVLDLIAFYKGIGARRNPQFSDATAACMILSETIHVMLLTRARIAQFTRKRIADAHRSCEVTNALSADDRAAVDDLVASAGAARDPTPQQDLGFLQGRSIEHPDGHIWEVFWMDADAVGKAAAAG